MQLDQFSTIVGAAAGAIIASAVFIIALKIKKRKKVDVRVCPRCGRSKVKMVENKKDAFWCDGCKYEFQDKKAPEKEEPQIDNSPEPPKKEEVQQSKETEIEADEGKKKKTKKAKKKKKKKKPKKVEATKEEVSVKEEAPEIKEPSEPEEEKKEEEIEQVPPIEDLEPVRES